MRIVRGGVVALVAAAFLALGGCTAGSGETRPSADKTSTAQPDATSKPAETEAPAPSVEAVIVVANVDVDGAHATASGYVSGVIEDGGACTFVFHGEPGEVTAESKGLADRASTSCGSVSVPIDQLQKGTWSVRLEYRSDDSEVVSEEVIVEVP
jgi:hypothetical protein